MHEPVLAVKFERDYADMLSCRLTGVAKISNVFTTEDTLGISCFCIFCTFNFFCGLFRLCKVDCDDDVATLFVFVFPLDVFVKVGTAEIGGVFFKCLKPLCRFTRVFVGCDIVKSFNNGHRTGHKHTHHSAFKEGAVTFKIHFSFDCNLKEFVKNLIKFIFTDVISVGLGG